MFKSILRIMSSVSIIGLFSSTALAGQVTITPNISSYGVGDNVIIFNIQTIAENWESAFSPEVKKPNGRYEGIPSCTYTGSGENCTYEHIITDAERGAPISISVQTEFIDTTNTGLDPSNPGNDSVISETSSVEPNDDPVAVISEAGANANPTKVYNNPNANPNVIVMHLSARDSYDGQGGPLTYQWREAGTSFYPSSLLPSSNSVISLPAPAVNSPPQVVNIELIATDLDGNTSVAAVQPVNVLPNVCGHLNETTLQSLFKFRATGPNAVNMTLDDAFLFPLMSSNLVNITGDNSAVMELVNKITLEDLGPNDGFKASLDSTGQSLRSGRFPEVVHSSAAELTGTITIGQVYDINSFLDLIDGDGRSIRNPTDCNTTELSFRVPSYSFNPDSKRPVEFLQGGAVIDTLRIPVDSLTPNPTGVLTNPGSVGRAPSFPSGRTSNLASGSLTSGLKLIPVNPKGIPSVPSAGSGQNSSTVDAPTLLTIPKKAPVIIQHKGPVLTPVEKSKMRELKRPK